VLILLNAKIKGMGRAIVHMDLDTFFVSCERLTDSRLNGIPLIIGGGERGVVASCSYEARTFGVHSSMPIKMALRLCPQAKVMKGDMELYSRLSHAVTEVIEEKMGIKVRVDRIELCFCGQRSEFFCLHRFQFQLFTEEINGMNRI
jgi:DNA polymerase-4